jgi:hypothetical protein
MYSIGHVIFGAPVTELIEKIAEERDEEIDSEDGGYFIDQYNGGGGPSGYIGVELASFDCCDSFLFDKINVEPTTTQSLETLNKVEALPADYRNVLPDIGIWVVWSSS